MTPDLKAFVDKILQMPISFGSSPYGEARGDMMENLRLSTARFAQAYATGAKQEALVALAQKIEGDLLTLSVVGKATVDFVNELIVELYALPNMK